jgi:hypothetical protein
MKKMLLKFADNLLSKEQMKQVKGGLCSCKQAAPYACTAAGHGTGGSPGHNNCMNEVYRDCESIPSAGC